MQNAAQDHHDSSDAREAPQIYVACLSSYNAGRLHGAWVDAVQSPEDVQADIDDMLTRSPEPFAEEWAIHTHSGFAGIALGEYESVEDVARVANAIAQHGPVVAELIDYAGGVEHLDCALTMLEEQHAGTGRSLEDWAYEYLESTGQLAEVPEALHAYFDFERFARDLEYGGEIVTVVTDGDTHVFWTR